MEQNDVPNVTTNHHITSSKQAAYKCSKQVVHRRAEAKLDKIEEEKNRMLEHRLMNYEAELVFDFEDEDFI